MIKCVVTLFLSIQCCHRRSNSLTWSGAIYSLFAQEQIFFEAEAVKQTFSMLVFCVLLQSVKPKKQQEELLLLLLKMQKS